MMMTFKRRMAFIGVTALTLSVSAVGLVQAGAPGSLGSLAAPQVAGGAAAVTTQHALTADVDEASIQTAMMAFGLADESGAAAADGAGRVRHPGNRWLRHPRRLVHAEVTVATAKHGIVTWAADHGTLTDVSGGTLRIDEAGDHTATVATDADTKVRVRPDGDPIDVADLKAGDEVLVISRQTDDGWVAGRVLVLPQTTSSDDSDTSS